MTWGVDVTAVLGGLLLMLLVAFGIARAVRAGLHRRLDERQAALRKEITETVATAIREAESRQLAALKSWQDVLRDELRELREQVLRVEERTRIRAAIPATTSVASERVAPAGTREPIEKFFLQLDQTPDAASYLKIHLDRIIRTLTLVPPPRRTGRALELGAYMQMTPALGRISGYREVVGGYAGALGQVERTATSGGQDIFRCKIDIFDAELDVFPYGDGYFDVVLACEIIEHLLVDPMHMLFEIHRVLDDDGALILTTPNVVSFTSVARVLEASGVHNSTRYIRRQGLSARTSTNTHLTNWKNFCWPPVSMWNICSPRRSRAAMPTYGCATSLARSATRRICGANKSTA